MARLASVSPVRLVCDGRDEVVAGLVTLFEARFGALSWAERLRLLEEIFDYLEENSRDPRVVRTTFSQVVERLVDRVGSPDISCREQAHVYAASGDRCHRRLAGQWFAQPPDGDGCHPIPRASSARLA